MPIRSNREGEKAAALGFARGALVSERLWGCRHADYGRGRHTVKKNTAVQGCIMTHRACRHPTPIGIVLGMKPNHRPDAPHDWTASSDVPRIAPSASVSVRERRDRADRRRRVWWSVIYGSFNPRRRRPPRRLDEPRFHSLDWHAAHLLAVAMAILLLSVADAFMTVTLLSGGAVEVNPVMAAVVYKSAALFAGLKMAMTGGGVMLMVSLARYRFMRVVRVDVVLYAVLVSYVGLLGYEFWMLRRLVDIPGL
jgi:hypothetical protein